MFCISQRLKSVLTRKLKRHKNKTEKVNFQRFNPQIRHLQVVGKNTEPKFGENNDHGPDNHGVRAADQCNKANSRFHPIVFFRSIVKTDNRLSAIGDAIERKHKNFPDGVENSHDAHIYVSTIALQSGVAYYLDSTVGTLHNKICSPQIENVFGNLLV